MTQSISHNRQELFGLTLVLLGALGFSSKAIIIKLAYSASANVDAITLMSLRMVFSLPLFLLVACWHNRNPNVMPLKPKQWLMVSLLGVLGYYLSSYLDFTGLYYISAGLERIILFLYPTFVVLFTALIYKRAIKLTTALALMLCYAGMILIFIEQLSLDSTDIVFGSSLVLLSALIFAFFTMGSGVMTHSIGSTRFTAYTMSIAGIATLIHFAASHPINLIELPSKVYYLALFMAVFATVIPAFFMNAGIRRIGAGPAAIISTTGPIGTLILAFFILRETITVNQLAGTLLVLTGVYVIGRVK